MSSVPWYQHGIRYRELNNHYRTPSALVEFSIAGHVLALPKTQNEILLKRQYLSGSRPATFHSTRLIATGVPFLFGLSRPGGNTTWYYHVSIICTNTRGSPLCHRLQSRSDSRLPIPAHGVHRNEQNVSEGETERSENSGARSCSGTDGAGS